MLPTLNLPLKSHPSSQLLFFRCNFSIKLSWLQKRDNKANNILSSKYIIYKTLKPFKKKQIIQNINNLMFQVNFIFSN